MGKTLVVLVLYLGFCVPVHASCSQPDDRFVIHDNGTVTDSKTGLMWKRCLQGQSMPDCSGTATVFIESDALNTARAEVFGGFDNWRIPKIEELKSIVATCSTGPAINLAIFPNAGLATVRTASYGGDYGTNSWALNFKDGTAFVEDADIPRPMRLVRDTR